MKLTAVHHSVSKLRHLMGRQNWRAAYQAADELDTVLMQEAGFHSSLVYTATTVTSLAVYRKAKS